MVARMVSIVITIINSTSVKAFLPPNLTLSGKELIQVPLDKEG